MVIHFIGDNVPLHFLALGNFTLVHDEVDSTIFKELVNLTS
jgi:hypothetical protein